MTQRRKLFLLDQKLAIFEKLRKLAEEHYEVLHDGKRDTWTEIWRIESEIIDLAYDTIGKKVGE